MQDVCDPAVAGPLKYRRSISLSYEGGWRYCEDGEPFAFEDQDVSQRPKHQRLTEEMLIRYARALGIRPFEEAFYTGPGVLFTGLNAPVPADSDVSLEAALADE
jgi:hypothetical protein